MSQGSLASDDDPIRTFGPLVADEVAPTPYCKIQTFFEEDFIRGRRFYFKSNFTRNINDEAIATLVERFATAPSPLSMVYFQQSGNAANRAGAAETAFSHRNALCEWGLRGGLPGSGRRRRYPLGARDRGRNAPLHGRQRLRQSYRP